MHVSGLINFWKLWVTYDLEVLEVRRDVAVSGEAGGGGAPGSRVWATALDIGGNAGVGEEPDVDGRVGPFGGVYTAVGLVESVAVRLGVGVQDGTTGVGGLVGGFDVAVVSAEGSSEARVLDGASVAGVEGHLVGGILVHTLDDVNLAVVGPVGAKHPANHEISFRISTISMFHENIQCRPGTADATGHVLQIQNHQTLIVSVGAGQTNTVTARAAGHIGVVNANVDGTTRSANQAIAGGRRLVDIVHVTFGGVRVL